MAKRRREEAQLEQILLSHDPLLTDSLRDEDRRRRKRRLRVFVGLFLLAAVFAVSRMLFTPSPILAEATKSLLKSGWTYWNSGQFAEAEQKFRQATEQDPKLVDAWSGLGWAQFSQMKLTDAEASFEECLKRSQKYPAALNGMGQLRLTQNRLADAKDYLTKAAPTSSAAWFGLARIGLLTGQYDEAEKWARKVLADQPGNDVAKQMIAAAKAKSVPDELRELIAPPQVADRRIAEGWKLMNSGDAAGAKEKFESVLKDHPDALAAHNGLGFLLLNSGEIDEAQKHFEACLKIEPAAGGPLNGLARCYQAQGDLDKAIETWKKMGEADAPHAGTVGLAKAYLEKEDFPAAVRYFEQLLKSQPQNKSYQAGLKAAQQGLAASATVP